MKEEINNCINFFDINIYKINQNISFNIYRKPTATDTIILNASCHQHEHKIAAIRYLANCIVSYPMKDTKKRKNITLLNKYYLTNNMIKKY